MTAPDLVGVGIGDGAQDRGPGSLEARELVDLIANSTSTRCIFCQSSKLIVNGYDPRLDVNLLNAGFLPLRTHRSYPLAARNSGQWTISIVFVVVADGFGIPVCRRSGAPRRQCDGYLDDVSRLK